MCGHGSWINLACEHGKAMRTEDPSRVRSHFAEQNDNGSEVILLSKMTMGPSHFAEQNDNYNVCLNMDDL